MSSDLSIWICSVCLVSLIWVVNGARYLSRGLPLAAKPSTVSFSPGVQSSPVLPRQSSSPQEPPSPPRGDFSFAWAGFCNFHQMFPTVANYMEFNYLAKLTSEKVFTWCRSLIEPLADLNKNWLKFFVDKFEKVQLLWKSAIIEPVADLRQFLKKV